MNKSRLFLILAVFIGAVSGLVLVFVPQSRGIAVEPFYWVLIAFVLADGSFGIAVPPPITMPVRLGGFLLAMIVMFAIPLAAGIDVKYF
jgi:hypothetical protein